MNTLKNIEKCNSNKKRKVLIVYNDMIADMLRNKKLNPILTELFIRGRKKYIYLVFITHSYFVVWKYIKTKFNTLFCYESSKQKRTSTNCINYSSDIDFQDFMNLYKKCTAKPYSFLVVDTTLASHNPLRFREKLVERILELIMAIDDKTSDEKLQYEKLQYCNIKTGGELFTNEMKNDKIKNEID